MFRLFHKSRKHPIIRDEHGRSAKQQAFDLYNKGYRPSQISKEKLIPVPKETLFRYYEDWKKRSGVTSRSTFKKFMKENPEFSEKFVKSLADYFGVSTEDIILRMQRPWGITRLSKGELPDNRRYRIQSEVEDRLDAALGLIFIGEQFFHNNPEQVKQLAWDITTLRDNTRLVIQKTKGQVLIRKEKLQGIN